ncbi:DUF1769-domain-containing protein [Trichodelitschia bisporula]|uniref:DUF1769-domain-containing protein n=1 Tax=Trichodelitschia bisporula TaxID=703511 RepID=A0A6G1HZZ3_9PEZI|nr:DUF1769-domain-containing protein [Trichodelitschia bisporula]
MSIISSLARAVRSETSSPDNVEESLYAEKYLLRVTAGPSYDPTTHKPVFVNTNRTTCFENEFMTTQVKVRIREYRGLPRGSRAHSDYFDDPGHKRDRYSISFSFVPKQDLESLHTVWGNDFDHPVRDRLPPGFNMAVRIVKEFIDPGIECDAYADEPWLYGPSLSCWFAMRIGEIGAELAPLDDERPLEEGADGSGEHVRARLGLPHQQHKRRKHFLSAKNRETFAFEKGRVYHGDFFNPYIDFNKFALRLPGFSIGVIRYIGDKTHNLRYVFKNRATGEVYFVVVFTLLFGDDVQKAVDEDLVRHQAEMDAETRVREQTGAAVPTPPESIGSDDFSTKEFSVKGAGLG